MMFLKLFDDLRVEFLISGFLKSNVHSKKYLSFPMVFAWKFGGNGQFSLANRSETEISISLLGNC